MVQHFDLVIIGSGSGNSIPDERFSDKKIAIVEKGTYGGTCLNVGCIPTKMFVFPADLANSVRQADQLGVELQLNKVRWPEIRDRIFDRIDPISEGGERWRSENSNVTLFRKEARFVGPKTLDTGTGETITADTFVLAAGSRAVIPEIPGIDQVAMHTSDTIMRLESLPESMIIIGGGFIAAEFAHVFASFGVRVTVLVRSGAMLRAEDSDVSKRFTELMADRIDLRLNQSFKRVESLPDKQIRLTTADGPIEAEVLLVATGRVPNSDLLDLGQTGVEVDEDGYVRVDDHQCTTAAGIFAMGDLSSHHQLKHVANHEMRVVQHNLLHPDSMIKSDHRFVPHAVFSEPQVAAVGLTEQQAIEQGVSYVTVTQDYGSIAYGWAMEDTSHFAKLLADPETGLLLGAHIIGPQASVIIQPLIQAMHFGLPADEMARGQYWIHPALPELVENALLALPLRRP